MSYHSQIAAKMRTPARLLAPILRPPSPAPGRATTCKDASRTTSGYNYLIQLIPVILTAPMFIRRDAEFGGKFPANNLTDETPSP